MRKIILFLIIASVFASFQKIQSEEVHLSYNILDTVSKTRKYVDTNGCTNFIMGGERFLAEKMPKMLKKDEIDGLNMVSIYEFLESSLQKRKKLINEGEKSGIIKIPRYSDIFDTIYLYEKRDGNFLRYRVEWIDEITD